MRKYGILQLGTITNKEITMPAKTRYSKQREIIYHNLLNRHDHPTAEQIYQDLKQDYPHLSMGTVYRNLGYLVDHHMIRKLDFGEQVVHYDGNTNDHYHFICKKCHHIYDIHHDHHDALSSSLQSMVEHHIDFIDLAMLGTCKNCMEKEKEIS